MQCARVWKHTAGGSPATVGSWGGEWQIFPHLVTGCPDQQMGHSNGQFQRSILKSKQARSIVKFPSQIPALPEAGSSGEEARENKAGPQTDY